VSSLRFVGVAALDRSGHEGNFPIIISTVLTVDHQNFIDAYGLIRDVTVKERRFLAFRHEIKAKHVRKLYSRERILRFFEDMGIVFTASIIDGSVYHGVSRLVKGKFAFKKRIDAIIWFKSLEGAVSTAKIAPIRVFLDWEYGAQQLIVQNTIAKLFFNKINRRLPLFESLPSTSEVGIMLADLVAGFLRSKSIREKHKDRAPQLNISDLKEDLEIVFK